MKSEEYKAICNEPNVLSRGTIEEALTQMKKIGNENISIKLDKILKLDSIQKPELHFNQESSADFFRVELDVDEVDEIVNMFGNLEVESLDTNYDTTNDASYFATMLDRWNRILE